MRASEEFIRQTEEKAFDADQRNRVTEHAFRHAQARQEGLKQYANLELAKERAAYLKWKVTENLDKYLIDFEATLMRRGGKILWAHDAATALAEIDQVIKRTGATSIIKARTMMAEEIGLTAHLRQQGIQVAETDSGTFIADQAGEPAFHMVSPVMQKSVKEAAALLNGKTGTTMEAGPEEITSDIREELRNQFAGAEICVTGANFLIADSGMVAVTENEGNIRLATATAKVHIVLAGIDKIIPALNDIDIFFPLLATYATGQKVTTYNSIIGPRTPEDPDGPAEFIVIMIDNGRTNLLAQGDQRQALSCIKCGACHLLCPVFKNIGGHAYGTTNNGPIGSVTEPYLKDLDEYKHLSFASPVSGNWNNTCPVKIDLHNHLVRNRRDSVNEGMVKSSEKLVWYSWKKMMLSRKNMNKGASIKNFMLKSFFRSNWGERREFPKIADKSFNQLWREKHNL